MIPERTERFAYALVSAAPLEDSDATGIGIVFKARDRSTLGTVCQSLPHTDALPAAYEAVMRVLEEALRTGVRRLTIYTDLAEVVEQLTNDAPVPRATLVAHLKVRGTINQLGAVRFVTATGPRFSARLLAESARLPGQERPEPRESRGNGTQLTLIAETASA